MLPESDLPIIAKVKSFGDILPAIDATVGDITAQQKFDISVQAATLMMMLQAKFDESNEPVSEEFFLEFSKALPPVLREMFIFGGFDLLSKMLAGQE